MIVKICHVIDVMVKLKELFKTNVPPIIARKCQILEDL